MIYRQVAEFSNLFYSSLWASVKPSELEWYDMISLLWSEPKLKLFYTIVNYTDDKSMDMCLLVCLSMQQFSMNMFLIWWKTVLVIDFLWLLKVRPEFIGTSRSWTLSLICNDSDSMCFLTEILLSYLPKTITSVLFWFSWSQFCLIQLFICARQWHGTLIELLSFWDTMMNIAVICIAMLSNIGFLKRLTQR